MEQRSAIKGHRFLVNDVIPSNGDQVQNVDRITISLPSNHPVEIRISLFDLSARHLYIC